MVVVYTRAHLMAADPTRHAGSLPPAASVTACGRMVTELTELAWDPGDPDACGLCVEAMV